MEEVNYMGEPYENTYNLSWRNHPNHSWRDQQKSQQGFNNNQGERNQNRFNNRPPFPISRQQMETSNQSLSNLATIVFELSKTTHSVKTETRSSIRNLEVKVGQLSKRIPKTPPNTLLSNTEVNPREEWKAITVEAEAESKGDILALNASKEVFTGCSTPNKAPFLALNASKKVLIGCLTPKEAPSLALNMSKKGLTGHSMPKRHKNWS
ncbi:hypothetical protein AHAS_Ahas04G0118600 [Arachis hypogaea]